MMCDWLVVFLFNMDLMCRNSCLPLQPGNLANLLLYIYYVKKKKRGRKKCGLPCKSLAKIWLFVVFVGKHIWGFYLLCSNWTDCSLGIEPTPRSLRQGDISQLAILEEEESLCSSVQEFSSLLYRGTDEARVEGWGDFIFFPQCRRFKFVKFILFDVKKKLWWPRSPRGVVQHLWYRPLYSWTQLSSNYTRRASSSFWNCSSVGGSNSLSPLFHPVV